MTALVSVEALDSHVYQESMCLPLSSVNAAQFGIVIFLSYTMATSAGDLAQPLRTPKGRLHALRPWMDSCHASNPHPSLAGAGDADGQLFCCNFVYIHIQVATSAEQRYRITTTSNSTQRQWRI